jgi:hypothetical protein
MYQKQPFRKGLHLQGLDDLRRLGEIDLQLNHPRR